MMVAQTTHGLYCETMAQIRDLERMIRGLKGRIRGSVEYDDEGGAAIDNPPITALLLSLHDWLCVELAAIWEELESSGGMFTPEVFASELAAGRGTRPGQPGAPTAGGGARRRDRTPPERSPLRRQSRAQRLERFVAGVNGRPERVLAE